MFNTIWNYRSFIIGSVIREFQTKYRNSLFGVVWNLVQPLSMILVYGIVFSQLMSAKLSNTENIYAYSIYLCTGIITWNLFSEIIGRCQNMYIENANLLKKINFPHFCIPTILVINALINFIISLIIFSALLILTGNFPGLNFIAIIPIIILQLCLAVGIGLTIGVINVFFNDVGHFFTVFLQFWFWLTPIVYTENILPKYAIEFIKYNPMYPIITGYHKILVDNQLPEWNNFGLVVLMTLSLMIFGIKLFNKYSLEIVDDL